MFRLILQATLALALTGCSSSRLHAFRGDDVSTEGLVFLSIAGNVEDDASLDIVIAGMNDKVHIAMDKSAGSALFRVSKLDRLVGNISRVATIKLQAGNYVIPVYDYSFSSRSKNGERIHLKGYPSDLRFEVVPGKITYVGQIGIDRPGGGVKAFRTDEHQRDIAELIRIRPNVKNEQIIYDLPKS